MSSPFDEAVEEVEVAAMSSRSNRKKNPWPRHGVYSILVFVYEFFLGPMKPKLPKSKDSQFKFIAERLISTLPDKPDQLTVDTTKQLLDQHRTIENTQARRRLEKWACWAIVIYLACVFLLLIFNGVSRILWPDIFTSEKPLFSDSVLYVILSTTTVNILGLGFIVLKGHFPQKEEPEK
ncbi:MAG: hypothetical protein K2I56_08835 [Muribaculaceae bacterium]|nr:hypothetical protein [Muribaculaceae bacterium]